MSSIHDRCRGRWLEVFREAGIDEKILNGRHHPCPACGGEDRFRYKRDIEGGYFCGSHRANGMDLLMHITGMSFVQACELAEKVVGKDDNYKPEPPTYAERMAERSAPLHRSAYLESRGLVVPPGLQCIRSLPYFEGKQKVADYPAIMAPVRHHEHGFRTYHATYVVNGAKAPVERARKILPGKSISGAAVQLCGQPRDGVLGVAEGIETATAAWLLAGKHYPVWSVLSTSGMRSFEWPPAVKRLVIYADNDANLAGHAAAYHLAHRALIAGVQASIITTHDPGLDMNDVLLEKTGYSTIFGEAQ